MPPSDFPAERTPAVDPRIAAVRADKIVGRGTCSVIDEAYTDAELVELFDRLKVGPKAVTAAVRAARRTHRIWHERANDIAGY